MKDEGNIKKEMEVYSVKYVVPLLIKFFMILFVLGIILWMFGMSFMNIFYLSILVTVISLVGDLFILPRYGNVIATIADFGTVFLVVLFGSSYLFRIEGGVGWAALTPAIVIALGEAFFHKYLRKNFFEDAYPAIEATYKKFDGEEEFGPAELEHLRTEFSNEFDVGNPDGSAPDRKRVTIKEKKSYVPHRRKKRNKQRPY